MKNCEIIEKGQQIVIPVSAIEFHNGGNTIWVHSKQGATTLRIKCSGKINVEQCQDSPVSHSDILIEGDINFCISKDAKI